MLLRSSEIDLKTKPINESPSIIDLLFTRDTSFANL
jgi:hypothetical protein